MQSALGLGALGTAALGGGGGLKGGLGATRAAGGEGEATGRELTWVGVDLGNGSATGIGGAVTSGAGGSAGRAITPRGSGSSTGATAPGSVAEDRKSVV